MLQAALERVHELLLAHHVAASLAPMELLDGPMERRAVDHRVVRRHGHPDDVAELVLHRAGQVVVDPRERQDERLARGTPGRRLRDRRRIADRLDPVEGRDRPDRRLDDRRRQVEGLEHERRDAPGGRAAVVRGVGQDQLVAGPGHRDVEEAPLLAELDLLVVGRRLADELRRHRRATRGGTASGTVPATRPGR